MKQFYARTNKNQFKKQCTRHEQRERLLRSIRAKENARQSSKPLQTSSGNDDVRLSFEEDDPLPQTRPWEHIHVSESKRHRIDLRQFVDARRDDPAFHVIPFYFFSPSNLT